MKKIMKKIKINRRKFLKKAAGAAMGAVGFPFFVSPRALGKFGSISPSNRITMGCIGTGAQGTFVMKAFLEKAGAQVVAVCDVNKESGGYLGSAWGGWGAGVGGREPARRIVEGKYAERIRSGNYKGCASYNDFREVLARDDIDTVLIGTPDHWHAIIGIAAAKAGKDVYCEKPLAYTVSEGRAVCDAVKKYGTVWQTGSQQRSSRNFRFACELVRNGRVGKVRTVKIGILGSNSVNNTDNPDLIKPAAVPDGLDYDLWLGPAPARDYSPGRVLWNWRWISDYSGGQITDWAGHHCDIAQWAMGTERSGPVEIEGTGVYPKDGLFDVAENFRFVSKYAEGFELIVEGSDTPTGGIRFEGDKGWIYVSRKSLEAAPGDILRSAIGPNKIRLYESNDHKQNFLDCVRTRRQPIAPAEVAQRSITVGQLGVIAIKLGRKLKWDPVNERFINDEQANRFLSRPMRGPWRI